MPGSAGVPPASRQIMGQSGGARLLTSRAFGPQSGRSHVTERNVAKRVNALGSSEVAVAGDGHTPPARHQRSQVQPSPNLRWIESHGNVMLLPLDIGFVSTNLPAWNG